MSFNHMNPRLAFFKSNAETFIFLQLLEHSSSSGFTCIDDGYYRHPANCSKFYQCDDGVAYVKECYASLVFNIGKLSCDWPENVPGCQIPKEKKIRYFIADKVSDVKSI